MRFEILTVAQVINLVFEYVHGSKSIGYITIRVIALIFGRIFMAQKKTKFKLKTKKKENEKKEEIR